MVRCLCFHRHVRSDYFCVLNQALVSSDQRSFCLHCYIETETELSSCGNFWVSHNFFLCYNGQPMEISSLMFCFQPENTLHLTNQHTRQVFRSTELDIYNIVG